MPGTNEGNKERKTSIFSYINYPQLFSSFYFYFPLDPRYTITPWPTPWNGPVTEDACTRPANTRGGEVLEGWQRRGIGGKFAPYNGISRCTSFAGDKVLGYSGRARSPPQLISSFFQSFISFTDRPRGGTLVKYWYPPSGFLGRVNIVSQPTILGGGKLATERKLWILLLSSVCSPFKFFDKYQPFALESPLDPTRWTREVTIASNRCGNIYFRPIFLKQIRSTNRSLTSLRIIL